MGYIIAVFKSRNSALKCYQVLNSYGFLVSVISTPKIKGLGCGICVKLTLEEYLAARNAMSPYLGSDFVGFYEIKKQFGELKAIKLQ